MEDRSHQRGAGRLILGFFLMLSLAMGGASLYLHFAPLTPGPEPAPPPAPEPAVAAQPEEAPRSGAERWADVGDALMEIAERGEGEVKARETAAWCYERSLQEKEDADVRERVTKLKEGMLKAQAEQAARDGAWDTAFDLYTKLRERNPDAVTEQKLKEVADKRTTLYYTYAGKAEEAMRAKRYDEAVELYEKALGCMEHEEGRRSLLLARVEKMKTAAGDVTDAPSLASMDYKAVTEFFKKAAGTAVRVTGGLGADEGVPCIRVMDGSTYVTMRIPCEGRSMSLVAVFPGADFAAQLIDYAKGDEVELVGTVLAGGSYSAFSMQGVTIQKAGRPETFAAAGAGRTVPIPEEEKKRLAGTYDLVYRHPDAFKGKVLKAEGQIADIVFEKGATVVTVVKPRDPDQGYYSISRASYQCRTMISFPGEESFTWLLDYDRGQAVEFEVEVQGEPEKKGRSSSSEIHYRLSERRPVVKARGISIWKKDDPDSLVKAGGGRAKPVKNQESYLARADIVSRAIARFKGTRVTFTFKMDSLRVREGVTEVRGSTSRSLSMGEGRSHTLSTPVVCYFPGGAFVNHFMDYLPGAKIEVIGAVDEEKKSKGSSYRHYYSHGTKTVYLKGEKISLAGKADTAVFADKGRPKPPENADALRARCYVVKRNVSSYVGTTVTWTGEVYDIDAERTSVCVEIHEVDPSGDYRGGEVALVFPGLALQKKLEALEDKTVVFSGKVMSPPRHNSDSLILEAISIQIPGDDGSRITVE